MSGAVIWEVPSILVCIVIGDKFPPEYVDTVGKSVKAVSKLVELYAKTEYGRFKFGRTQRRTDHGQQLPAMFRHGSDINVYLPR
ncbi:MAG: hypothetical protein A3J28_04460 [Acidobacteria bacterium RIFCSPLOWO2_12_FULL_60_22]|nr:MAG: hypothetical protein A3J28_04460 [Acidobacteria bacterium RIFCSPLOWO2_12_FULL_60_22]